jgi:hypothetical protein
MHTSESVNHNSTTPFSSIHLESDRIDRKSFFGATDFDKVVGIPSTRSNVEVEPMKKPIKEANIIFFMLSLNVDFQPNINYLKKAMG